MDRQAHVQARLLERFGIAVELHDIDSLDTAAAKGLLLYRQKGLRDVRLVKWRGVALPVVYSRGQSVVVTVLPNNGRKKPGRRRRFKEPRRRGGREGRRPDFGEPMGAFE